MLRSRRDTAVVVALAVIFLVAADVDARPGYLLTAPKVLLPGAEQMCVTFHDIDFAVQLTVQLRGTNDNSSLTPPLAQVFEQGRGHCFSLEVPSDLTVKRASLVVQGGALDQSVGYTINETKQVVSIGKVSLLTFIQTDKPIYKPGQKVQFRILSVKPNLKPRLGQIDEVWIEDPNGVRISQWTDVSTRKGLASLQQIMSPEPVLGKWMIKTDINGQRDEQAFTVDEYVLPKYEITITPLPYLLVNAQEITGEVCAKYTYGEPVKGTLNLNITLTGRYGSVRPSVNINENNFNGCYTFIADAQQMRLADTHYPIWGVKLGIDARVTEAATGIELTATHHSVEITRTRLTINIGDHSQSYFKPGLPYNGKCVVQLPGGAPAANEVISLDLSNYQHDLHFVKNYTTNAEGEFLFSLPAVDTEVNRFSIQASAAGEKTQASSHRYTMHQARTHHNVRQWYSPTGSFLQVEPLEEPVVSCHGTLQLPVKYTTEDNTNFKFYYQVMARGNIVASGHKRHHFRHHGVESPHIPVHEEGFQVNSRRELMPPEPPRPTTDTVQLPPHVAEFILELPVSPKMSPKFHLLVYYVREDGETVADNIDVDMTKCFDNDVELRFDAEEKYPGERTNVYLRAAAGSLCAYGVVDKSVTLLGGNNQMTLSQVFEELKQYELSGSSGAYQPDTYCQRWYEENQKSNRNKDARRDRNRQPGPPGPPGARPVPFGRARRPERSIAPYYWGRYTSDYDDSMTAFKDQQIIALTDQILETRPCRANHWRGRAYYSAPSGPGVPDEQILFRSEVAFDDNIMFSPGAPQKESVKSAKPVLELRSYFPETWLWDLEEIGDDGEAQIRTKLPHTITEWIGSAFCTSEDAGLGVSQATAIKGFQPFFVSFTLPYSVVRGEKIVFPITAFNYLSECQVIELTLKRGDEFTTEGSRKGQICVCGGESKSHMFTIVPTQIGDINITVKAESKENDGICGNGIMSAQIGVKDAVTRSLVVEPEGTEEEYSISSFVCPTEGQTYTEVVELALPTNLVPDSARSKVLVIGDVMGPSLSGLEKLIRLPTGCGEQNMLNFAPNIFVMQYLTHTNQLGGAIETTAKDFMTTGYQRELNYKHHDHSYSAFGNSDTEGSMWLTAFVVKCFAQARPFIFIDPTDLAQSMIWFQERQLENGCFPQVGRVLHKDMKGGLEEGGNNPATLTAFVLISMLEADIERNNPTVEAAIRCLNSQTVTDTYTVALMAYAYSLWDRTSSERQTVMDRLEQLATREEGVVYWKKSDPPAPTPREDGWVPVVSRRTPAANVEMTAYALMSYLAGDSRDGIVKGLPVVQWLSKQRNAYGGFSSTQDTVVALQALSKFAAVAYGSDMDMTVKAEGRDLDVTFAVNADNSLVLQQEEVPLPNTVTLTAAGTGCVFVQTNVKYNVNNATVEEPAFSMWVEPQRRSTMEGSTCKHRDIDLCVKYTGSDGASNMAVVAAKMVSGWIPHKTSLRMLEKDPSIELKRFEVDKNMVHFYFDEITAEYKCFRFTVEQDIEVRDPKPAYIQVYDYYETEKNLMKPYKISLTCGTKEELPFITHEEWLELQNRDPDEVGQVRIPPELPPFGNPEVRALPPGAAARNGGVERIGRIEIEEVPECATCLSEEPSNAVEMFCAASHAFKGSVRQRDGEFSSLKIGSDIRPQTKVRLNENVDVMGHVRCGCPVIFNGAHDSKVLVLTNEDIQRPDSDIEGSSRRLLRLTSPGTSVMPVSNDLVDTIKRSRC